MEQLKVYTLRAAILTQDHHKIQQIGNHSTMTLMEQFRFRTYILPSFWWRHINKVLGQPVTKEGNNDKNQLWNLSN
jgi:hypothetical protein